MAYSVSASLFCVLIFLVNYYLALAQDYMKREHSLVKPYQGSGTSLTGLWDFSGSTMVTHNYVRLTSDHQSKRGQIWNTVPCYVRDWEAHIHFKVHGSGADLFGDGFAVWYARDRNVDGPVFGSKDYFHGLAIFLDTYSNHNGPHEHTHPYVSAMVNNGSLHYDHDRDGTHTQVAGCEASFRNKDHETFVAIRYTQQTLTVSLDIEGKNNWKECFTVKGVRLPTGYYFGASATTGELADNHDIVSIKVYELEVEHKDDGTDYTKINPEADYFASPRDHVEDPKPSGLSGLKLLALIIIGIIGVGIAAMVGFIIYSNKQEESRKRFY